MNQYNHNTCENNETKNNFLPNIINQPIPELCSEDFTNSDMFEDEKMSQKSIEHKDILDYLLLEIEPIAYSGESEPPFR